MKSKFLIILLIIVAMLVNGCNKAPEVQEEITLKVMDYSEYSFNRNYGTWFEERLPHVKIEIIPTESVTNGTNLTIAKLIQNEQPDVIKLESMELYKQMANEGLLVELDPLIQQDQFDIENIYPPLIEYLRSMGSGSLYGLSPNIESHALFFNKDIFDHYRIPYPTNQMSWEDLLQLAQLFPANVEAESEVYGYFRNGLQYVTTYFGGLVETIAEAKGLSFVNDELWKVTINTDQWKEVFQLSIDALDSGSISLKENVPMIEPDLFLEGRAATSYGRVYKIYQLEEAHNENENKRFSWGLVTLPVEPEYPNLASWKSDVIYAVNAQSKYVKEAWDFVKIMNGDELAREFKDSSVVISSRTAYNQERLGHDLSSFLYGRPSTNPKEYRNVPQEFYFTFREIANQYVKDVLDKKISIDQALKDMQKDGQLELDKLRLEIESDSSEDGIKS